MNARRIALLATLLLALPAAAQAPAPPPAPAQAPAQAKASEPVVTHEWRAKTDASTLTYKLIHKLHEVEGKAHPSVGVVQLKSDGKLLVQVRANVKDFDSGNNNRDVHMQEVTEAAKYPIVEVKGEAFGVKLPDTFPATMPLKLKGKVTFHGVVQEMELPMTVTFTSVKDVSVDGTFDISLDAFKVERPSLLMVKVDDKLVLEPKLVFTLKEGK